MTDPQVGTSTTFAQKQSAAREGVDVSIVIPTRDRAQALKHTLQSVSRQRSVEKLTYEIIVVDDGSTDGTRRVVDVLLAGGRRDLTYLKQNRTGVNAARNRGFRAARGSLICFIDDDVTCPQEWLSEVVKGARKFPNVECFAGRVIIDSLARRPRQCSRREPLSGEFDRGMTEQPVDRGISANLIIRPRALNEIGEFTEDILFSGEETEWCDRLKRAGGTIMYLPKALVLHRRTEKEMELWHLIRKRFTRGWQRIDYIILSGTKYSAGKELIGIARVLGHAATRLCTHGLMSAAFRVGLFLAWAWTRVSPRRVAHLRVR